MIAIDFAVVPTVKGQLLFVFVVLSLVRMHIPSEAEQAFRLKPNTDSD